jgi:hypothetical protein
LEPASAPPRAGAGSPSFSAGRGNCLNPGDPTQRDYVGAPTRDPEVRAEVREADGSLHGTKYCHRATGGQQGGDARCTLWMMAA